MKESSHTARQKRFDETLHVTVDARTYDVHIEYHNAGSYSGYVIYRGAYFCTLPYVQSKRELLEEAQIRIRALR